MIVRSLIKTFALLFGVSFLLCGCWGKNFPGWDATDKAGFERMAAARLQNCVQYNDCIFVPQCHRESEAYCVDAGYAESCGRMEPEGSCGSKMMRGFSQSLSDGGHL